ncbi:MAG: GatB/YqeY domain-containing protein [Terrimicrobiaceae bacterium]|nr:GatB/YqeY domain-containing protein [Terrimicrobiaceae bacterium]
MSLLEKIDHDIKEAMRAKDSARLGVLRMAKSALKNAAIEKGGAAAVLDDAEAAAVLRKQIKQREDAIAGYEKGGRPELAAAERAEIAMLEGYLPKPLDAAALEALVREAIAEAGASSAKDMGAVMKIATARAAGRADGRVLSAEVRRQLG